MNEPVAILIFNRPEKTERLIAALRVVKPAHLLVIGDGPRSLVPTDAARVEQCRKLIDAIDWPCRIDRHFSDTNMGCRRRVSSGIDWVFSLVERAVILEDDCVPDPSFFSYCTELLEKYKDDLRVMSISGTNGSQKRLYPESYSFSRYVRVWGWASWRRAWKHYDVNLVEWSDKAARLELLHTAFREAAIARFWARCLDRIVEDDFDTWDYQWSFAHWIRDGLSIIPAVNLVSNIGFDSEGTHTKRPNGLENLPRTPMDHPMRHPVRVIENRHLDAVIERTQIPVSHLVRARNLIKGLIAGWK